MDEIVFTEGFKETLMDILCYCADNKLTAVTLEFGNIEMDIEFRAKKGFKPEEVSEE